ncbi:hypothetical protein HS088_TW22G00878 [Tripterygium wilfordii]|uniref:CRM domain-containing protein n=1 Tax=Tripterygium wilfordii TaxID=458696 RepID=A0A7J7BZ46_TRIWF|nr:uncharacterized protein LOC119990747 [Tripterygium wilfordii]KAF5727190.1 hypothetical protein HS088_TW22G00878 [Tripterygium wilfordii]
MATTMSFLLRPLCLSSTTKTFLSKCLKTPLCHSVSSLGARPRFICRSLSSSPSSITLSQSSSSSVTPNEILPFQEVQYEDNNGTVEEYVDDSDDEQIEIETENRQLEGVNVSGGANGEGVGVSSKRMKLLSLTVKEKKELASYAHSLGKKLKSQLVGKSGVTDNVAASFVETLEANELLKVKIHRTCPGELEDVVKHLEEATGSVVVGLIGRTVIIYRPSVTKMEAEEKKKQARRPFVRKETISKRPLLTKGEVSTKSRRGRRGISRFA